MCLERTQNSLELSFFFDASFHMIQYVRHQRYNSMHKDVIPDYIPRLNKNVIGTIWLTLEV